MSDRAAVMAMLLVACVASGISVVSARQQARHAFIELSKLRLAVADERRRAAGEVVVRAGDLDRHKSTRADRPRATGHGVSRTCGNRGDQKLRKLWL